MQLALGLVLDHLSELDDLALDQLSELEDTLDRQEGQPEQ
jgi:hypothetical protein